MHGTTSFLLFFLAAASFLAEGGALQPRHRHGGGCVPAERAALLSFKLGIMNDSSNILGSWRGEDCCGWRGVGCSNRTGHVIRLHLGNTIPDGVWISSPDVCHDVNALFGEISPSLLSLKHLEKIDLSMNCLVGRNGLIPEFLGSMDSLRYLNLSGIPFIGRVPSQLGNLSKLQCLDLSQTYSHNFFYNKEMYSTDISWLMKLPLLQYLGMSGVNLSVITDWPHTLNMIQSLIVISLSRCLLDSSSQSLPYFNLTKLEKLDLSWNMLRNSIVGWIWKATSLKYLRLNFNALSDPFFDALGNKINITSNLKNLCSLEILDLSYNFINEGLAEWLPQCKRNKLHELNLRSNGLTEMLPNFIGQFPSLRILDMSYNQHVGVIPLGLLNLTSLTSLDLSNNEFTGSIPTNIGKLGYLTYLDLSYNQLIGVISPGIWNLTSLTTLHLLENQLTGRIPADLGKLRHLTKLDLSGNNITGPIPPEIMNLTRLANLYLYDNNLNGIVPTEIGSLTNLIDLCLHNNSFSGVITEEHLAGLKNLKNIALYSNNLKVVMDSDWLPPFTLESALFASCQMGPLFPAWFRHLKTTSLDISSTGLKGEIPNWFWSTFSQAVRIDISSNQIKGSLPALDGMTCEELYLGSNMLTGTIPLLPINIRVLDISNNTLTGTLPSNFEALHLQILLISSNQFGGYIPESFCKLEHLLYLDLSNNILEGEIPECSVIHDIQFLLLSNNTLSGQFPAFLQSCRDLEFLDLSLNKFSGRLPPWIGELGKLRFLLLGHNTFFGNIPVQITNLDYIQYLDLSSNSFSGAIPWHLSNLTSMTELKKEFIPLHDYASVANLNIIATVGTGHLREIFLVTKGRQQIYGRTLTYFVGIDLSDNSLTGEIPKEITSLDALLNLNLSSNHLSGNIPINIGALRSLESLDLSKNKISGEIPSSLSNLSSLSYLNLSYNNLYGRIPSGRQLDTLSMDNQTLMYIGNNGLCGPPLQKNCSGNNTTIHDDLTRHKQEFDPMTFHFGLVMGLVVGHWIVFCAILFKKTWRIAYFQFFDKLIDMIYVLVAVNWTRFKKKNIAAE